MIDLYTWTTPNGRKVSIALEELALEYTAHAIDITQGEQHGQHFLTLSPNAKIPAIVDHDNGCVMMESGAILLYLSEKTGHLMPTDRPRYWEAIQWVMWQMAGPGPLLGQVHHFTKFNPGKSPYAQDRYLNEGHRLYGVLNQRLEDHEFIVDDYSMVDIAVWPWISRFEWQTIDMNLYPNIVRWYREIADRPAVQSGYQVPKPAGDVPMPEAIES